MEYTEQTQRDGTVHLWGVRWDLDGVIRSGTSLIVTHIYERHTSGFNGPPVTDVHRRLVIKFQQRDGSDGPGIWWPLTM